MGDEVGMIEGRRLSELTSCVSLAASLISWMIRFGRRRTTGMQEMNEKDKIGILEQNRTINAI